MKASHYWSLLNGYWTMFKDRHLFTALWDAMIKACSEYAEAYERVAYGGILSADDNMPLTWEKISISPEYSVSVIDSTGSAKDYDILSIASIVTSVGGVEYLNDIDFTFDVETKKLTWIHPPSEETGEMLAKEIHINARIVDSFYNSGLYDIELNRYTAPSPKWVLYACIKHFGYLQTQKRLHNIISILAGVPFSKFYGTFSSDGEHCDINYAINVSTDYESFLLINELDGYCYIDEETGQLYDGIYPDEGTILTLCHKHNLSVNDGVYSINMRGERYPYSGSPAYSAGELMPIYTVGGIEEGDIEQQYVNRCLPIYDIAPLGETEITAKYILDGNEDVVRPVMELRYTDNISIEQGDIRVTGNNEVMVKDPLIHVFNAGDDIILTDVSLTQHVSSYCNIISGSYNDATQEYLLTLSQELAVAHNYVITIPIIRSALCPVVESSPPDGNITVGYKVDSSQNPILCQCPAGSAWSRKLYVESGEQRSVSLTLNDNGNTVAIGDTIAITSSGEQDYYTVAGIINWPIILVSPELRRDYSPGDAVYNVGRSLDIGRIRVSGNDIAQEYMHNIERYLSLWMPELMVHFGYTRGVCEAPEATIEYVDDMAIVTFNMADDEEIYYTTDGSEPTRDNGTLYENKNIDMQIKRDLKYWQLLDSDARKEIKE